MAEQQPANRLTEEPSETFLESRCRKKQVELLLVPSGSRPGALTAG